MNKQKRLFFAVNIPAETKGRIAKELLTEVPSDKWRIVKTENLHVTMRFLGHLPGDAIAKIEEQVSELKEFDSFEAELTEVGHFKNRILWLGIGKGSEELKLLSKKLCSLLEVTEEQFHPHATLGRNRGSKAEETDFLIENLRKKWVSETVPVESIDLMESVLHKAGPEYSKLFSIKFRSHR